MPYPLTGPFNAGTAPGLSAAYNNNLETWLATALQKDGDVKATAGQETDQTLSGSNKTYMTWKATDGKTYALVIETTGRLGIYNVSDSVWVLEMQSGGHLLTNGATVWDSGNDGSGSGLDADTLDGHHASDFVLGGSGGTFIDGAFVATVPGTSYTGYAVDFDAGGFTSDGNGNIAIISATFASGKKILAISTFSGSGSGTYSHGLGRTPTIVLVIQLNTGTTAAVGSQNLGSSTVGINIATSTAFLALAITTA